MRICVLLSYTNGYQFQTEICIRSKCYIGGIDEYAIIFTNGLILDCLSIISPFEDNKSIWICSIHMKGYLYMGTPKGCIYISWICI